MSWTARVASHDPARIACIEGDRTYTYADLTARAADVRAHLVAAGIGSGDRVSIASSSEYTFVCSLLGILGAGGTAIPTNPLSPLPEMQRMLGPLDPALIIASPMAASMVDLADAPAPVVAFDSIPVADDAPPANPPDADAVALLMMTSGTSGPPKAAALTRGNLDWAAHTLSNPTRDGVHPDDVVLACLPTAHIFGLTTVTSALWQGATLVLRDRYEAEATLALIAEHECTLVAGAPLMWRRWMNVDTESGRDVHTNNPMASVRRGLSGAAPLPPEVRSGVLDRFALTLHQGYGMTETSSLISSTIGYDAPEGSAGIAFSGMEVMIVDDDGAIVDSGDTGEVVVRGPGVFAGYEGDDEATAQVLTEDGWLWTGDIAAQGEAGHLYLVDRAKDVVIVSGFNVYPAEVEEVLRLHPLVELALVVGEPCDDRGEQVVAYVRGSAEPAVIDAHVAENLAGYKRPSRIEIVDEIPMTAAGKLLRREMR